MAFAAVPMRTAKETSPSPAICRPRNARLFPAIYWPPVRVPPQSPWTAAVLMAASPAASRARAAAAPTRNAVLRASAARTCTHAAVTVKRVARRAPLALATAASQWAAHRRSTRHAQLASPSIAVFTAATSEPAAPQVVAGSLSRMVMGYFHRHRSSLRPTSPLMRTVRAEA
jgi:hypothetical protein